MGCASSSNKSTAATTPQTSAAATSPPQKDEVTAPAPSDTSTEVPAPLEEKPAENGDAAAGGAEIAMLVPGEKIKLKKQGTMGTVKQLTTTDVQVEMEDGTVVSHDIEDLDQVTPVLKIGERVYMKLLNTTGSVKALTTTDVEVEADDGTIAWHAIEDLTALLLSASSIRELQPDAQVAPAILEADIVAPVGDAPPASDPLQDEAPIRGAWCSCTRG